MGYIQGRIYGEAGGGGGCGRSLPYGFDYLPTQRVPLCTILRYSFLAMDPKIFLKAPWVPIYTNFEGGGGGGERAPKFSKKCLKTPFSAGFLKVL